MSQKQIRNSIHILILLEEWSLSTINICKIILISKAILVLPRMLNPKMIIREILKIKVNNKTLILMIYFPFDFIELLFIIILIIYYNLST